MTTYPAALGVEDFVALLWDRLQAHLEQAPADELLGQPHGWLDRQTVGEITAYYEAVALVNTDLGRHVWDVHQWRAR